MPSIVVAGHICLDIKPQLSETAELAPGRLIDVGPLSITLGGSVANTGSALASLGVHVTPFSSVGDDELAQIMTLKLAEAGFAAPHLSIAPGASTSYSLVIERPGEDRTFWHHTGANGFFDGESLNVGHADAVHIGYPSLLPGLLENDAEHLVTLLKRAKEAGALTSIDLAVVDPASPVGRLDWDTIFTRISPFTDLISPSLDDLTSALHIDEPYSRELVERMAQRLLDDGVAIVAISAGSHGMLLRTTSSSERIQSAGHPLASSGDQWLNRTIAVEPIPVTAPETTNGAGDASSAGLLFAITHGANPREAAHLATACAAAVMSGKQPTPAFVSQMAPELSAFMKNIGENT